MVQAQRQTISQLRDQLEGQGFVEKTLTIGGAQYSVWTNGCADPTNPEVVSQFMRNEAGDKSALRVFAIDRETGNIGMSREGFAEVRDSARIRGLGESYGRANREAREAYEREHPPEASKEAEAEAAPVVQPPVVQPSTVPERVAAQTTTEGALFTVYVFNTVIEPTESILGVVTPGSYDALHSHAEYYRIDLNMLSLAERRAYEELRDRYSNPSTAYDPNQMPEDLLSFIGAVSGRDAWINPGAATQGAAFMFFQHAAGTNITSNATESYTFRVDLNRLNDEQRDGLEDLLRSFNPTEMNNLQRMQNFLNSLPPGAVLQRPTMT